MVQDSALLWTIVQKSKQESMSDSIWSLIQQSAIGPRWKSCYLSSWRTSHWVTVQNMIHFLVLDRTWLRKPYYMDGVKKLKLHKQNGLDTKKKQEVRKCSCEIYDFMSTSIWYEVREKRKPLDRLLPNWPMAAKSIVFEDSYQRIDKEKGFIGKSRQKEELSKGWRPAKPFSSAFFLIHSWNHGSSFFSKAFYFSEMPVWCRKWGLDGSLFQSLKKLQGAEHRKNPFKSKQKRPKVKEKLRQEKGGVEKERVTKKFKLFCPSFTLASTKGKGC